MANVPSISWNENSPAGSDNASAGDNRIRELKKQIREVIDVDHDFPSSGQAEDVGQHKKVTLQEQADLGTGASGTPILGAQTVDGKPELVYTDEDDNDIQITTGGVLKPSTDTTLANWSAIMNLVYPVGSVYTNASDSTNPATLLGIGTWVAIEGECVVGLKPGDADFGSVGSVASGEKTHQLTVDEMPSHNHTTQGDAAYVWRKNGTTKGEGTYSNSYTIQLLDSAGGDVAHNNIQPSYVCYVWRRTA